jgi:hypothetical protein
VQNLFILAREFFSQEISRLSASLLLAATLAILAGCGSGSIPPTNASGGTTTGATGTTTGTTGTTATAAATVQLLVSSPQIPSSGATTVDLTAVVLSASKQTVSGKTVTFSPGTDATAFISNVSGTSDDAGVVTAKLNLGTNKVNRTIAVTATADAATASNSIDVVGTAITVSGNGSVASGASTTLTFSLKDSAGTPLQGVALSLSSQTGNTIVMTPATGITNSSGQISAVVTASKAGNDVLTASGGGTSATKALTVSSASFAFSAPTLVAPATTIDIPLSPPTTVSVNWNDAAAGGPQVGKQITFASSRGVVSGSPATTDAAGSASVTVSSPSSSGPTIITASGPGGTPAATLNVVFVATVASSVTVQSVPSTIQVTTSSASQTTNSSTITAVVRDAAGNLIKNAGVNFSITADPSGGALTAARGITDVSGSASVTYIAGNVSSPQNGVKIAATVSDVSGAAPGSSVANTTALTVTGQSLFVRLGAEFTVGSSPPLNIKKYFAIVTDSGGHPVSGTEVRFVLRPGGLLPTDYGYLKGFYSAAVAEGITTTTNPLTGVVTTTVNTAAIPAMQIVSATCANEDTDFSGIINAGKDLNQNGQLDPGGIASVSPNATTDANGIATASITYPKSHATWVKVTLEARTGVAGNDPPALATFVLPGLITDYEVGGPASFGSTSPYGASAVCSNTL